MLITNSGLETVLFLLLQTNLALAVLSSNPGDFNVVLCGDKKGKTPECTSTISNREAQFVQQWGYRLRLFLRRHNITPKTAYQRESDPNVYGIGSDIPGHLGKMVWDMDWDENGSSGLVPASYASLDWTSTGVSDTQNLENVSRSWWYGSSNTDDLARQSQHLEIGEEMDGGDDFYYPSSRHSGSGYTVEDTAHEQQRIMEQTMGELYGGSYTDIQRENQTDLDVLAEDLPVRSDPRRSRIRMGKRYLPIARQQIVSPYRP